MSEADEGASLAPVRYRVGMPRPHSHLFELEAHYPAVEGPLELRLPVWSPGSYLVREYARHVREVRAFAADGHALAVLRVDKRTFRIASGGGPVRVCYRVYANELSVRTSHLDGTHGYFNGPTLFLYAEELRGRPHRVEVEAPAGWEVFCALDREAGAFVAPDYDALVDSPFEVGPHPTLEFEVLGVPHRLVIYGGQLPDPERMRAELTHLCEEQARLFGELPLRRYLFLLYLTGRGRGGLEHRASCTLFFPREGLGGSRGWEDLLTLVAHEYFHLWNVKRITPSSFVPLDYGREAYTRLLWAFEGITGYYDNLLTRRAGLMSAPRFLMRLGETASSLLATPGRHVQDLEEASVSAWIKHHRPDESSPNSAVSYYRKGELVAALLDLTLRRLTADARSLDDVMRLLWVRYGDGRGVPEDGIEAAAAEVAGTDLRAFFDHALRSTAELDFGAFAHAGLALRTRVRESPQDRGGTPPRLRSGEQRPRGWLGITTRGARTMATVLDDSPAMQAGVYAGDELVAVNGFRCDAPSLLARADDRAPGERLVLTVFRRDRLLELPVLLGARPDDAAYLVPVEEASEAQRRAYQAWLGAPWPES